MEIKELETEARKLGYRLVKDVDYYVRLKKCTCGTYPEKQTVGYRTVRYKCPKCGRLGPIVCGSSRKAPESNIWVANMSMNDTNQKAREAWNNGLDDTVQVEKGNGSLSSMRSAG